MIVTKYVVVKVNVIIPHNWKKVAKEETLDLVDKNEVAEHIVNECDYRFEFPGEKIGSIGDTVIVGMMDAPPVGV